MQYTGLYLEKHLKLQHFIISVLISILIKPVSVHTHTQMCDGGFYKRSNSAVMGFITAAQI